MKIKLVLIAILIISGLQTIAQGVAINEDDSDPDASALLDVKSNDKGVLIPRMTQTQRIAIASPAIGLLVYQTDGVEGFWFRESGGWISLSAGVSVPISASDISGGSLNSNVLDADLQDLADGSLSGNKVGTGISASNVSLGTLSDARLETTIDRTIFNASDYISALGGVHVGGASDPNTDNLLVDGRASIGRGLNPSPPDPEGILHLSATSPINQLILQNNNQPSAEWFFNVGGASQLSFGKLGTGPTAGTHFHFNNMANLGIGTTSPSEKLTVNGNIATNLIRGFTQSHTGLLDRSGNNVISFDWDAGSRLRFYVDASNVATLNFNNGPKTFIINHPIDESRYLVHATIEGPESAVFYRGKTRLKNGVAEISLPSYFSSLTRQNSETISLSAIGKQACAMSYTPIDKNAFKVYGECDDCEFSWLVIAERKDALFDVEPAKKNTEVRGFGPYKYLNN